MKQVGKILFWVYFAIASASLVVVIIYLVNQYRPFVREFKYQSELNDFNRYFALNERVDSSFTSLFYTNPSPAIEFLNRSEAFFYHKNYKSRAEKISPTELSSLDSLYNTWPVKYKNLIKKNILGIYIIDTATFNALTQVIPSRDDRFIIYLNAKLFKQYPNKWITNECTKNLKEEFKSRVKYELFSEIENVPIKTVEHVLIHEFSHIISFLDNESPLPNGTFKDKHGYYPLIESCFENGYIRYDSTKPTLSKFFMLSDLESDLSDKLNFEEFKNLTQALTSSPFPTPYSTRNAYELVAESFAFYVHLYHQNNKFRVIFDNSDTMFFAKNIDTAYIKNILK